MSSLTTDTEHPVIISGKDFHLEGILHIPDRAIGLVLFVHGSGSSRFSSRNQFVARSLQKKHIATLLFDLLTPEEDEIDSQTKELRFDIELLSTRLELATHWVQQQPLTHHLPLAYFGASTGGGAAIVAAAKYPQAIKAIVSRGGRPDLANDALTTVEAPTLLIVGGNDGAVIDLNKKAMKKIKAINHLEIIPGASHLFEEPGALDQVAQLAETWFTKYFKA